jgi:uncharacterized protein YndB with AHSA1/START domain
MDSPSLQVPPVKGVQIVRAGAGRVWEALTTAAGLEAWFATRVLASLPESIHLRWKEWGAGKYTGDARWDIEAAAPRKALVFNWVSHPSHGRTRVAITLEPRGPITVVRVEETGFLDVQGALDNSGGWGEALVLLKVWLEHGIDASGRRRRVDARKPASRRP